MNKSIVYLLLIQLISDEYTNTENNFILGTSNLTEGNKKRYLNLKLTEDDYRNKATKR